jgi:hypothetical protein
MRSEWRYEARQRSASGSQLDDAHQPEDYQHDEDHADDSDAATSVHLDLPFSEPVGYQPISPDRRPRILVQLSQLGTPAATDIR